MSPRVAVAPPPALASSRARDPTLRSPTQGYPTRGTKRVAYHEQDESPLRSSEEEDEVSVSATDEDEDDDDAEGQQQREKA